MRRKTIVYPNEGLALTDVSYHVGCGWAIIGLWYLHTQQPENVLMTISVVVTYEKDD